MNRIVAHLRSYVELGPPDPDRTAPLRIGLGVAIPSLVLLLMGRPELIAYAVFGGFAGMYGRGESHLLRLRHQLRAAVLLLAGVGIGVVLAGLHITPPVLVVIEALLAGLGSIIADRAKLRPAGPFFGIFALGACASIPPHVPPWVAISISVGSAAFAIAIGFAGWFRSRASERGIPPVDASFRRPGAGPMLRHAATYVVAVGAAGAVVILFGGGHAYWAMASAAVPLAAADLPGRVHRGIHRILGTFAGLVLTALILLPGPSPMLLAIPVILLQFPTEMLMTRNYALALTFFTPLILLMTQLAHPIPKADLLVDRAVETVIGAVVGIAVVLVVGLWKSRPKSAAPA